MYNHKIEIEILTEKSTVLWDVSRNYYNTKVGALLVSFARKIEKKS